MSGKSPRLNVAVTDEQHKMLLELGKLQGRSAASYFREMLDLAEPAFAALLKIERAAKADKADLSRTIQEASQGVVAHILDPGQGNLFGNLSALSEASAGTSGPVPASHMERSDRGQRKPARAPRKRP